MVFNSICMLITKFLDPEQISPLCSVFLSYLFESFPGISNLTGPKLNTWSHISKIFLSSLLIKINNSTKYLTDKAETYQSFLKILSLFPTPNTSPDPNHSTSKIYLKTSQFYLLCSTLVPAISSTRIAVITLFSNFSLLLLSPSHLSFPASPQSVHLSWQIHKVIFLNCKLYPVIATLNKCSKFFVP